MARGAPHARRARRVGPGEFLLQGFDWRGRTGRAPFGVVAAAVGALAALLAWGPGLVPGWSRPLEAGATALLALLLVPAAGHAARRLNDMGWRGWWAWLLLVPYARLALAALLVVGPPGQRPPRAGGPAPVLGPGVAGLAALALLGGLLWTTAPVLAQDMKPALLPGDVALVRRAPVPLAQGDVIAFRDGGAHGDGAPRLGRVVARGGERVAVRGGVPVIDGVPARQEPQGLFVEAFAPQGPAAVLPLCGNGAVGLGGACETRRLREALPGGRAHAVLDAGPGPGDEAAEITVPPGHLFVLGDHRDAARDSRLAPAAGGAGLVPEADVIGRVALVLASSAAARPWDPRGWRPGRVLAGVE